MEHLPTTQIFASERWKTEFAQLKTVDSLKEKAKKISMLGGLYRKVGASAVPSRFLCALTKSLELSLESEQIDKLIRDNESKYLQALAAVHVRLVEKCPHCVIRLLRPLLTDTSGIRIVHPTGDNIVTVPMASFVNDNIVTVPMSSFVNQVLLGRRSICNITFPPFETYSRGKHDKDHVGLMSREVDNQKDPNDDISGDISEDDFSQNQLNSIAPIPVEQLGMPSLPKLNRCDSVCNYFNVKGALHSLNLMLGNEWSEDFHYESTGEGNTTAYFQFRGKLHSGTEDSKNTAKRKACQSIFHDMICDGDRLLRILPRFEDLLPNCSVKDYITMLAKFIYKLHIEPKPQKPPASLDSGAAQTCKKTARVVIEGMEYVGEDVYHQDVQEDLRRRILYHMMGGELPIGVEIPGTMLSALSLTPSPYVVRNQLGSGAVASSASLSLPLEDSRREASLRRNELFSEEERVARRKERRESGKLRREDSRQDVESPFWNPDGEFASKRGKDSSLKDRIIDHSREARRQDSGPTASPDGVGHGSSSQSKEMSSKYGKDSRRNDRKHSGPTASYFSKPDGVGHGASPQAKEVSAQLGKDSRREDRKHSDPTASRYSNHGKDSRRNEHQTNDIREARRGDNDHNASSSRNPDQVCNGTLPPTDVSPFAQPGRKSRGEERDGDGRLLVNDKESRQKIRDREKRRDRKAHE